jgi:ornithine cyclodeaminase/alanine dehydrogenase-like protein (mu-crystallin family)
MLYLNSNDILKAVNFTQIMDTVEDALELYEKKEYIMPERMNVGCGNDNVLLLMPCLANKTITTKILTLFPNNRVHNKPVIEATVILNDGKTGEILSIMDGKTVTALRTAAISGVNIRHTANKKSSSLGIVGCGAQGFYQLLFACTAANIKKVFIYDNDPEILPEFIRKIKKIVSDIEIEIAKSPDELLSVSDIIITATTSRKPIFSNNPDLFKGKCLIAVGSFEHDSREYPDAVFQTANKIFVDIDYAKEESGELLIPLEKGLICEEEIESLGHFISHKTALQAVQYKTTFTKSVGMALFYLTTANLIYKNAFEKKIGTILN